MAVKRRFCARCKTEIPTERVEALPETRLCVKCSQDIGGEHDVTIVSENMAKTGSLKKNYGGWTIQKKRKPLKPKED